MNDLEKLKKENQNLMEIVEVAKQITSVLEVDYIVKNTGFVINSKFEPLFFCFILPADIDDDTPDVIIYEGPDKRKWELSFKSIAPLVDYFEKHEYNHITYDRFRQDFPHKEIADEIGAKDPDFLIPLRSDKGIIGVYMQGKKSETSSFDLAEVQYAINLISFVSIAIENANLYRKATVDRMTKLYTHHQFHKRLEEEISKDKRYGGFFSLIMFDIDNFKKFNDTYGHLQGDVIIKQIARILLEFIREVDFAARYGGEEFAIILPETDMMNAARVAERLREKVENFDFPGDEGPLKVTISMGISQFVPGKIDFNEQIIDLADGALYHSKESGRNKVSIAYFNSVPEVFTS